MQNVYSKCNSRNEVTVSPDNKKSSSSLGYISTVRNCRVIKNHQDVNYMDRQEILCIGEKKTIEDGLRDYHYRRNPRVLNNRRESAMMETFHSLTFLSFFSCKVA